MKFKLPSDTKELLRNPNETLDNVIKMVTQWDTQSMSYRKENTGTDKACPYCKKLHHTLTKTVLVEEIR